MLTTALFALLLQSSYRAEYPLPDATVPSGLGVNVHVIEPKDDSVARIAATGFKWIRMDLFWNEVEHHKGVYDFSHYDNLNNQLRQYGIRPIYILDYGNDYYQKGAPRSAEARAAFVRFVHAAVQHYRHQGVVWEMYNEPNVHFWQPSPNVDEYVTLATDVGEEIRRNEPDEWFIGPAVSSFDWAFLIGCMKGGLLQYWDAVSVHPYRTDSPDTVVKDWQRLRYLIQAYAPNGRQIGMICSEWGFSSLTVGERGQADYAARMYLANLASGVPLTIWYDWKDDANDKRAEERHFGLVTPELSAKPSHTGVATVVKELAGWKLVNSNIGESSAVLIFRRGGRSKAVAWAIGSDEESVHIALPAGDYAARTPGEDTHVEHAGPSGLITDVRQTPMYFSPVLTGK